ncbi:MULTISPECIES: threonine ammonia-lyase [Mesorhizobium]|uniref:Threonine/serine dehydratase n=1 Tax=Mesorhizobium denitrificans TaxID=2294114 RepID=A0A371XD74_9HYPH|nr:MULTISPECIES: threonine/serine dehydratase [Mesorhizobium]RFC67175.1 threonine/serine dehydratase [Mesorhizobium denitrificans]
MITLDDIDQAQGRIAPYVRCTPLIPVNALSAPLSEAELWLKLECLQATGSFKARGATNKLLATPPDEMARGVTTASGGNHGVAVARAAKLASVPATIFVPTTVTPAKIEKLRNWGATVEVVGSVWNETNLSALAFARDKGCAYFHPFADPYVVAGQGTLALEILDQQPDLDAILIAIGGGGLITGMAVALKALKPSIRIVGIEPVGAPTFCASLAAGHVVRLDSVTTRVATMACAETDADVFARSRNLIDDVVLIEDDDMLDAARWLWFEMGLAADLSGAAAIAALLKRNLVFAAGQKICALVCGAGPDGLV